MANTPPTAVTELGIQFLDVGQGDGIYVEFPGGTRMLVDFGSTRNKKETSEAPCRFRQSIGISTRLPVERVFSAPMR